jgi:hypothetical protein
MLVARAADIPIQNGGKSRNNVARENWQEMHSAAPEPELQPHWPMFSPVTALFACWPAVYPPVSIVYHQRDVFVKCANTVTFIMRMKWESF